MRKIKGLHIDAKAKTARIVEVEPTLDEIYRLADCSCITSVRILPGTHFFCDDNGYLTNPRRFFKFRHIDTQWFAGSAICFKTGDGGSDRSIDPIVAAALADSVVFMECDSEDGVPELPPPMIMSFDSTNDMLKHLKLF